MPFRYDKATREKALKMWVEGRPPREIAGEVNTSDETIVRWAKKEGLETHNSSYCSQKSYQDYVDLIIKEAEKRKMTGEEIQRVYGINARTIRRSRVRLGLPALSTRYPRITEDEAKEIIELSKTGKDAHHIAQYIGVTTRSVHKKLKDHRDKGETNAKKV